MRIQSFSFAAICSVGLLGAQCPPSPNLGASVQVQATATFDGASRTYLYQYTFTNNGTKDLGALLVAAGRDAAVTDVRWPAGWDGGWPYLGKYVVWSAAEAPAFDGRYRPPASPLRPGQTLAGFSFRSTLGPGQVALLVEAVHPPLDENGQPLAAQSEDELQSKLEEAGLVLEERGCNVSTENTAVLSQTTGPVPGPSVTQVTVRVKPDGPSPQPVNPNANGNLPVAVLSTATFSAPTIDPTTVQLGPGKAPVRRSSTDDVNRDGRPDLLMHFDLPAVGLRCTDTAVFLTGRTYSGQSVQGSDTVRMVGCK